MTTVEQRPVALPARFRDELLRPALVLAAVTGTIVRWPSCRILFPVAALPLFAIASITAIGALFPWTRLSRRQQLVAAGAAMLSGALLLPLAHQTTTAALFPYIAAGAAGGKLASRRAAVGVASSGAGVAAGATWLVGSLAPTPSQWQWWVALTVGLPVYIGVSARNRLDALCSAQLAAEEARRVKETEAREAALVERGRIAREIHDVLGHALSGIVLQLGMADALRDSGRDDEAMAAVRRARALAVESINETRRAVHALREGTLPLSETLRRLAEHNAVDFEITGSGVGSGVDSEADEVGSEAVHMMVRAAQEALTNAARYAPGAWRTMRLAVTPDSITVTVRNGPATEAPRVDLAGGTGVGLVGIRERAALLGGTLQAEPNREGGWTLELELPR